MAAGSAVPGQKGAQLTSLQMHSNDCTARPGAPGSSMHRQQQASPATRHVCQHMQTQCNNIKLWRNSSKEWGVVLKTPNVTADAGNSKRANRQQPGSNK